MNKIVIIGLGPGRPDNISRESRKYIKSGIPVYYRTLRHPLARRLAGGKRISTFDWLDQRSSDNHKVNRAIALNLIKYARKHGTICYTVPGHPLFGEASVAYLRKLCGKYDLKLQILPAPLPPFAEGAMEELIQVMTGLRAENGCPWDKQQNHHSLRQYLVEEAYEVIAAIDQEDDSMLKEELGDLLLQVVFHSQIAREEDRFDFYEVVRGITEKLLRRHPHVFGNGSAADSAEVKVLWEEIKSDERNRKKEGKNGEKRAKGKEDLKDRYSVDHSLPALLKAYKLQKKAAEAGFDWPCVQGPLDKAREELDELEEAYGEMDRAAIEEELGDYLFTVVNLSRFIGVNPELALGKTVGKFMDRFHYVLEQVEKTGHPITSFSLETLDKWWEEAKKLRKMRN